jgi:hypothetical protein
MRRTDPFKSAAAAAGKGKFVRFGTVFATATAPNEVAA